jgi:hypothetical protein
MANDLHYQAEILAHSLSNEVNTYIALSSLSYTLLQQKSELSDAQFRSVQMHNIDVPIQHWFRYVLACVPDCAEAYSRKVFAFNSENILVPDSDTRVRSWISAVATDINSTLKISDPALASELNFPDLLSQGCQATFYDWAKLAILTDCTDGLDSGYITIVPKEHKARISKIWADTE